MSYTIEFNSSSSFPKSGQIDVLKSSNCCARGYRSNLFVACPLDMVMFPNLQLIFAFVVANHGQPSMIG